MRILETFFAATILTVFGVFGSQPAAAQSNQPTLQCPTSSCNVLVCSGGICTMYSCNSSGCRIVATWRDPAVQEKRSPAPIAPTSADPWQERLTESLVLGANGERSRTLFSFTGDAPLGVKVCSDEKCGAFVLHRGISRKVGETPNLDRVLQDATSPRPRTDQSH